MVRTCGKKARSKNCECSKNIRYKNISEGKGFFGKPRRRWLDYVANDLNKMAVRGWRKIARDKDDWKLIRNEARVLLRP
jgi:hypothetical protein